MSDDGASGRQAGGARYVQLRPDPSQAERLSQLDFTDLFFSEQGEAYLRGLHGVDGALAQIPDGVTYDLEELHRRVCHRGQTENEFFCDYDSVRFRVSRIDEVGGTWFTLRRLMWPIPRIGELGGINPRIAQALIKLGHESKKGLILISGATSAGKTTTGCSLLQEFLLTYGNVAVTVEDPVELPLSGFHGTSGHCLQTQVKNGDFAEAMKLTMRRAPRYIYLGEVRSRGEASAALRAGINGHLVITTIHAGNCIEAIDAMLKLVAADEPIDLARQVLASGLLCVTNQSLVRKVNGGRALKLQTLFFGDHGGVRSLVRSGKTEQLSSEIDRQASRVLSGKTPLEEIRGT
jgi:Tfp pilus assembly pilus retraction ATPase PilT